MGRRNESLQRSREHVARTRRRTRTRSYLYHQHSAVLGVVVELLSRLSCEGCKTAVSGSMQRSRNKSNTLPFLHAFPYGIARATQRAASGQLVIPAYTGAARTLLSQGEATYITMRIRHAPKLMVKRTLAKTPSSISNTREACGRAPCGRPAKRVSVPRRPHHRLGICRHRPRVAEPQLRYGQRKPRNAAESCHSHHFDLATALARSSKPATSV